MPLRPTDRWELAELQDAARQGALIRLVFPKAEVVLENVTVQLAEPGWARIE